MSTVRAGQPGATRVCPHCKATVLESAAICPGCRHHLRFASAGQQLTGVADGYCAFSVVGTLAHKLTDEPCEYCIVLDVSNERGEQIMRQVVGVGALQPGELRRLNLSVDMLPLATPLAKAQATQPPVAVREGAAMAKPATAAPAPAPGRSPGAAPGGGPATPAAAAAALAAASKTTLAPTPGTALGQRLRIFRKP